MDFEGITYQILRLDERCLEPTPDNKDIPFLRACDLREAAGLTYRQLNNWEAKGVLPSSERTEPGWRKFSYREVFAIMICSDIKQRFGVPLESLRSLQLHLLDPETNFLGNALERIFWERVAFYLLTDLKSSFKMLSIVELGGSGGDEALVGEQPAGFILLKLNELVNRILLFIDKPFQIKTTDVSHDSEAEQEILRLVRDGTFSRVSVQLKNGRIFAAEAEREIPRSKKNRLLEILSEQDFQTVTMSKQNGEIVRITQKLPIKFPDTKNALPRRQKKSEDRGMR